MGGALALEANSPAALSTSLFLQLETYPFSLHVCYPFTIYAFSDYPLLLQLSIASLVDNLTFSQQQMMMCATAIHL